MTLTRKKQPGYLPGHRHTDHSQVLADRSTYADVDE